MLHDEECPECNSRTLIYDFKSGELFCSKCRLVIADNLMDIFHDETIIECEECESRNIICDYDNEELFCGECGEVIKEGLSDRCYTEIDWIDRFTNNKGLGTLIYDWDYEKLLSSKIRSKSYILRRWQKYNMNSRERSFIFALSEIDRMACALRLPVNIREAASVLYRKAMKKRLIRGRSIEGITTALLYITCRQYGVPRTLEEVRDVSRVEQKEISRAYHFLLRELDLKVSPASPIDFVPRFCSLLGLGGDIRSKAIEIIKKAMEEELTNGRGPIGIVAAAIYLAADLCGVYRTGEEILEVTSVTESTLRNRAKELVEELDIAISKKMSFFLYA